MCHDTEPLIFPERQPMGILQGQDTNREKKELLLPLSSLLQPSVLSVKLRAKGERLFKVSLLGRHLSGDGAHARSEEEATREETSRQQL